METVGEDMVEVSRPMKRTELRITGLDDSTTSDEVAAAIAAKGGCAIDQVKVGVVRRTPHGTRLVWVRCPISAAKLVTKERWLQLGWIGVRVTLLQPRESRCYPCMEVGHTRQSCKSVVDRSSLCFGYGKNGHKVVECISAPHWPLCAEADKPADHRLGSRACVAPPMPPPISGRGNARCR